MAARGPGAVQGIKKPASCRERVAADDPVAFVQVSCVHTAPESSTRSTLRIRVVRASGRTEARVAATALAARVVWSWRMEWRTACSCLPNHKARSQRPAQANRGRNFQYLAPRARLWQFQPARPRRLQLSIMSCSMVATRWHSFSHCSGDMLKPPVMSRLTVRPMISPAARRALISASSPPTHSVKGA